MINEAYCSFEVSKLLKEKGFDEACYAYYMTTKTLHTTFHNRYCVESEPIFNSLKLDNLYDVEDKSMFEDVCSAPTHQMAMAWLREEKDIHIIAIPTMYHSKKCNYTPVIHRITNIGYGYDFENGIGDIICNSYNEAIEAALLYTLKNLI